MDVTVVIASFGERHWLELGQRAAASAFAQDVPVIYVHGQSLHGARNAGLAQVETSAVVFLDADDQLQAGYCETLSAGTADLRVPSVQYVTPSGRGRAPYVPRVASHTHECEAACITSGAGNWIIVGAMVRTELVRKAGGWLDWPVYEDFCLWMRVLALGASVEVIPEAVYIAYVRRDSRNRNPAMTDKNATHHAIVRANLGELIA
jgi:glycosyltransferase involved in cell wall biosynthesis